ncbi:MAG: hypothetical protein FWC79_03455 [Oscillospiraceae bacterium]|nr:hypothetical protein [Oscillospiraceae bacterium]
MEIRQRDGGGVRLYGTLTNFTMSNGTINDNTATRDGGGVFIGTGTFIMNSGTISENTATGNGGGVYVWRGTFTIHDGEISGNNVSGVHINGIQSWMQINNVWTSVPTGSVIMNGGEISDNSGNGVNITGGVFTMNDGSINENGLSGVNVRYSTSDESSRKPYNAWRGN